MAGNEKEKPPDPGGGNSMDLADNTNANNAMDVDMQRRKRNAKSLELTQTDLSREPHEKRPTQGDISNASVSTFYSHPDLEKESRKYNPKDCGPFIVHISRETESPNAGTSLQPIRVGQIFANDNVPDIKKDGIKSLGRNRVAVECKSADAANKLMENPCLARNKLTASIPSYHVSRMGLVRGVPVDWSMEEFVSATDLKEGSGKILKARRLQCKVLKEGSPPSWVPTQSVVVTFEGQNLPSKIYAFYTSLNVEIYVLPTIQCRKCLRFGHIQTQCRSDARCFKCAKKHPGETCNISPEHISCLFCTGCHFATDKNCPEFGRQKTIKLLMSEQNISYQEAAARTPTVRKTYSDVANTMFSPVAPEAPRHSPSTDMAPSGSQAVSSVPQSRRQTIYRPIRPRTPLSPSYDRFAHQNIISTPSSQLPNGHALSLPPIDTETVTPNDNSLSLMLALMQNHVAMLSDLIPNNVAHHLAAIRKELASVKGPYGQYSTVE